MNIKIAIFALLYALAANAFATMSGNTYAYEHGRKPNRAGVWLIAVLWPLAALYGFVVDLLAAVRRVRK